MRRATGAAAIYRSSRWKAVRLQVKRRDGWKCVECGERSRIEVDHIKPIRDAPELAFEITNLQCLCIRCHARKTRLEIGLGRVDPERDKWKSLVRILNF